ncbi:uncharacterized protein LOC130415661 isoform X4 [Triplophysa dalaica]|uniref:uncharacterized protein LOC130415661 isoform X4 n=1 Tax=Triplophysa dalaica TaxID=1582913 RepID=UPI0024DF5F43|nr:uncharacterized protein LOC130415661 isoform X4 [Triplophysa dalaica]
MLSVLLLLGIGVVLANCEVGMVDDQQFNSMKTVPMAEWMRQNEEVYHLDRHVIFKSNIQVAKERFNQSTDDVLSDAPADKPDSLHIDDDVLSDVLSQKLERHDSLRIDDDVLSDAPADKPDSLHIDDYVLSDVLSQKLERHDSLRIDDDVLSHAPADKPDSLHIDDKVRRNTDDVIAAENRLRTYALCTPSRRHEHR